MLNWRHGRCKNAACQVKHDHMNIGRLLERAAILLLLSISSAGCQTQFSIADAAAKYRTAMACCRNLMEIKFGQLSSGLDTSAIIDNSSPAFNLSGAGLTYFAAFELPGSSAGQQLVVQSNFIQDADKSNIRDLFLPVVMLLDQQKNRIYVTDGQIGSSISEGMVANNGTPYVETRVDLRQYPAARYFIVFTRPELFANPLMIDLTVPGSIIAAGRTMIQTPPVIYTDPLRASPTAPRGSLTIRLQG